MKHCSETQFPKLYKGKIESIIYGGNGSWEGYIYRPISLVVMLLIALSATKYYFVKKAAITFFGIVFYSMALAFLSKILITFLLINYKVLYTEAVRSMQYTTTTVKVLWRCCPSAGICFTGFLPFCIPFSCFIQYMRSSQRQI